MKKETLLKELAHSEECLERSTRVLTEKDSAFAPALGMMTVSQQMAHIAATVHWLVDGALSKDGFDMDFAKHAEVLAKVNSLQAARVQVKQAFAYARQLLSDLSEAELALPMAEGPVMGGAPRYEAFLGVVEHTAHHRGALTVYSRVLGIVPLMPYMEM